MCAIHSMPARSWLNVVTHMTCKQQALSWWLLHLQAWLWHTCDWPATRQLGSVSGTHVDCCTTITSAAGTSSCPSALHALLTALKAVCCCLLPVSELLRSSAHCAAHLLPLITVYTQCMCS